MSITLNGANGSSISGSTSCSITGEDVTNVVSASYVTQNAWNALVDPMGDGTNAGGLMDGVYQSLDELFAPAMFLFSQTQNLDFDSSDPNAAAVMGAQLADAIKFVFMGTGFDAVDPTKMFMVAMTEVVSKYKYNYKTQLMGHMTNYLRTVVLNFQNSPYTFNSVNKSDHEIDDFLTAIFMFMFKDKIHTVARTGGPGGAAFGNNWLRIPIAGAGPNGLVWGLENSGGTAALTFASNHGPLGANGNVWTQFLTESQAAGGMGLDPTMTADQLWNVLTVACKQLNDQGIPIPPLGDYALAV
jgi:hypothetical protein